MKRTCLASLLPTPTLSLWVPARGYVDLVTGAEVGSVVGAAARGEPSAPSDGAWFRSVTAMGGRELSRGAVGVSGVVGSHESDKQLGCALAGLKHSRLDSNSNSVGWAELPCMALSKVCARTMGPRVREKSSRSNTGNSYVTSRDSFTLNNV